MRHLLKNVRFYILSLSIVVALGVYTAVSAGLTDGNPITTLTESYALAAVVYLYLSLMVSPITEVFVSMPWKRHTIHARRSLGVSAFMFACLHAYFAFFKQLLGFAGLLYLGTDYLVSVSLGATSLLILTVLTLTSTDRAMRFLGTKWKWLHKLVYLVAVLIFIHAIRLGGHFTAIPSSIVAKLFFTGAVSLALAEAWRFDRYLERRRSIGALRFGMASLLVMLAAGIGLSAFYPNSTVAFNIHTEHQQIAAQTLQASTASTASENPALRGDRTLRFSVGLSTPEKIEPGMPATFTFKVDNAATGEPIYLYTKANDRFSHLIVVDNQLESYQHLHPETTGAGFVSQVTFPHAGTYHVYIDFQPFGAIEQQFGFTVVAGSSSGEKSVQPVDAALTKTFGNHVVTLKMPSPLQANKVSVGEQKLTFTVADTSGKSVTDLKPYLAAFGHMVMINQKTYDYVHVHPSNLTPPAPDQNGGPDVEFMPLGLYSPIRAGTYRVFAQFNPGGNLMLADFTIRIE